MSESAILALYLLDSGSMSNFVLLVIGWPFKICLSIFNVWLSTTWICELNPTNLGTLEAVDRSVCNNCCCYSNSFYPFLFHQDHVLPPSLSEQMALRGDRAWKHTHRQHRVLHLVRICHHVEQGHRTVSFPNHCLVLIRSIVFFLVFQCIHQLATANMSTKI